MKKAFLSYSHRDKGLIDEIAKELGRQYCLYDTFAFRTGDELRQAVLNALDASSVFVLLASKKSLDSVWVKFETGEAELLKLQELLTRALVYIIDDSVTISEIPNWLQKGIISREKSAKTIARDIRFNLDEFIREDQQQFFVGRHQISNKIEEKFIPIGGDTLPNVILLYGLPGIGRRSVLRKTIPSILNINKFLFLRINEGDNCNDICLKIADKIEPYSSLSELEEIGREIQSLTEDKATERIIENLEAIQIAGELPVLFDENGIVDTERYFSDTIESVLKALPKDIYLAIITTRRPIIPDGLDIPIVHIPKLSGKYIQRLISLLANRENLSLATRQITELAEYLAGYPPSAYFAIEQIKQYGYELITNDIGRIVEFRSSVFLRHFKEVGLGDSEQELLKLLAGYSPLPYEIIVKILEGPLEDVNKSITKMIDLAFIYLDEDGLYRIAEPIANAATRAFGILESKNHENIRDLLKEYIKTYDKDYYKILDLVRSMFRSSWLVSNKYLDVADSALFLASDMIKLVETFYHGRKYEEAINVAKTALTYRPHSAITHNYLVRAYIQKGDWGEASSHIESLREILSPKELFFLEGFLERKRRNTNEALSLYNKARQNGRRGADISREIAMCQNILGDNKSALENLYDALAKDGDNPFLVDLWVKFSTEEGDEEEARKALKRLEILAAPDFYNQRLSRVELRFRNIDAAKEAAVLALENKVGKPPFEVLAQLVICSIGQNNCKEAEDFYTILKKEWGDHLIDIQLGLSCRIELCKGNSREAYFISKRTTKRGVRYYKIMETILKSILREENINESDEEKFGTELKAVEREIQKISTGRLVLDYEEIRVIDDLLD